MSKFVAGLLREVFGLSNDSELLLRYCEIEEAV